MHGRSRLGHVRLQTWVTLSEIKIGQTGCMGLEYFQFITSHKSSYKELKSPKRLCTDMFTIRFVQFSFYAFWMPVPNRLIHSHETETA